jgi:hypothetical protein
MRAVNILVTGIVAAAVITAATLPDRQTVPATRAAFGGLAKVIKTSEGRG